MIIGVPKEIKNNESRVGLTPRQIVELCKLGHTVLVQKNAGVGSGFSDSEYQNAGGKVVSLSAVWKAEMIVKVKEPMGAEYGRLKKKQILFTYLHLSGVDPQLTDVLLKKKVTAIAYETVVRLVKGRRTLPLLTPMSEVAGRMSVQVGSEFLARYKGGRGVLIDGTSNVSSGTVVIIGAGSVGMNAVDVALGRGANVVLLNRSEGKLKDAKKLYSSFVRKGKLKTGASSVGNIKKYVKIADILVGAVLVPGGRAPTVVSNMMVKSMQEGSVIVDVAIDQGGCVETSRGTSHQKPVYLKHGIVHYCVTNMPGAYPRTSTIGLTNATAPYVKMLAACGADCISDIRKNYGLASGLQTYDGFVVNEAVAQDLKLMKKFRNVADF